MNLHEKTALHEKTSRAAKMAKTYLSKAENLGYASQHQEVPLPVGWYWDMVEQALDTSEAIIAMLPDDYFVEEDVPDYFGLGGARNFNMSDLLLERAEKIIATLEGRRKSGKRQQRIEKLSQTTGRTPEEAEAFRRKVEEMQARG